MSKSTACDEVLDERAVLLTDQGLSSVELEALDDAVRAAAMVRSAAALLGCSKVTATAIGTSAGALAENAVLHGGGGHLTVHASADPIVLSVSDRGSGSVAVVSEQLQGRMPHPASPTFGAGIGLSTVRQLMTGTNVTQREGGGLCVRALKHRG